jgi:hypothetical protein
MFQDTTMFQDPDHPETTLSGWHAFPKRRLAQTMRAIGFIPLKSRRLAPGGFRGTTRPIWELGHAKV